MEIRAIDKDVEIPLLKARSATPDIVNVEKRKTGDLRKPSMLCFGNVREY